MIRESVLKLLADVLPRQRIKALDAAGEFQHRPTRRWQGRLDGLPFPEAYGGSGGSNKDLAVFAEALGQHYGGVAVAYLTSVVYAGMHLLHSQRAHQAQLHPAPGQRGDQAVDRHVRTQGR